MGRIVSHSSQRAHEVDGSDFPPCCGQTPQVLRWHRRTEVHVSCRNPACVNHELNRPEADCDGGVFAGESDIRAKWERYRIKAG